MPAASDILKLLQGQLFDEPTLPRIRFQGKTVVITGANHGLGFECAKQMVDLEVSTLVLVYRDLSKGEGAKKRIQASCQNKSANILVWHVDMAHYASVKSFAERMQSQLPRLDAIIANAGISTNVYRTAGGLGQTPTVNVVAPFLLGLLALPLLDRTANERRHKHT